MERAERSWKVSPKLESFAKVGKFGCSWKVVTEVGKSDSDVVDDFGMLTPDANVKRKWMLVITLVRTVTKIL